MDAIRDAEARREKILNMLTVNGNVRVTELSELLDISSVTIRSDLNEMEQRGLLLRVHGGAISKNRAYYQMSLNERSQTNTEKKWAVAAACARLIKDDDIIMINSGTTTTLVMKELKARKNLTVITNSLAVAREAELCDNARLILLGGSLNYQYQYTYGEDTLTQLNRFKADKVILSADGISPEGLTSYQLSESAVDHKMVERSYSAIVVADSTKIGNVALSFVEPITAVDILITNADALAEPVEQIRQADVEVILA